METSERADTADPSDGGPPIFGDGGSATMGLSQLMIVSIALLQAFLGMRLLNEADGRLMPALLGLAYLLAVAGALWVAWSSTVRAIVVCVLANVAVVLFIVPTLTISNFSESDFSFLIARACCAPSLCVVPLVLWLRIRPHPKRAERRGIANRPGDSIDSGRLSA
jgi:hypothetical protein